MGIGRAGTRRMILLSAAACAATGASPAWASEIIARDASRITLKANAKGEALVSYSEGGKAKNLLAWGAVNAIAPTAGRAQVAFRLGYAGGWGKYRSATYAKTFADGCARYDGPPLPLLVIACKAPDGSYWSLQSWQRMLPNLGLAPWTPKQAVQELHASHWRGQLPSLEGYTDWVYSKHFPPPSDGSRTRDSRCSASVRRRPASPWTPLAATSTSTRSNPRTAPAGNAR